MTIIRFSGYVRWNLILCCLLGANCTYGQGTFRVHFDQAVYLTQPGGVVPLSVSIAPVPSEGLYSYGVSIEFDPAKAVLALAGIEAAPPLDNNGVAGIGALKAAREGFGGVKGTVNFAGSPPQSYSGALVATFFLTDRSLTPGNSYSVDLGFFRTLGASETIFVDGSGKSMDARIVFEPAVIQVVPEPRLWSLIALSASCCMCRLKLACGHALRDRLVS